MLLPEQGLQMRMGARRAHPVRTQAEAPSHAVDVSIHRKSRPPKSKEQHNRRRLRPDTLKTQQPAPRLFHRQLAEKLKR